MIGGRRGSAREPCGPVLSCSLNRFQQKYSNGYSGGYSGVDRFVCVTSLCFSSSVDGLCKTSAYCSWLHLVASHRHDSTVARMKRGRVNNLTQPIRLVNRRLSSRSPCQNFQLVLSFHGSSAFVCTNVEFDVCEIAYPHSRLLETSKPRNPSTPVMDTCKHQGESGGTMGTTAHAVLH